MSITQRKANRKRRCPETQREVEKYQAGSAYEDDVQVIQRTLGTEYDIALAPVY